MLKSILYDDYSVPLGKKVTDFDVKVTNIQCVRDFIETWHYSKSVNGLRISHVFGLYCDDILIGAMIYGPLGMANAWRKYGESESDVIELRRLCCIDDTPKCTESYFIGKTQRWLKKNTDHKIIVSYADAHYNHTGIIYRATNFKYEGLTSKGRVIEYNGRTYHDKAIRTKYKGKLKPFAQRLKDALDTGDAKYIQTPGKHIYTFELIRK
tara:strand:+ start:52 stop:681 length:630 start_codon:yes stop_codon:yes gene_type:complete